MCLNACPTGPLNIVFLFDFMETLVQTYLSLVL